MMQSISDGFWAVVRSGISEQDVLRQFALGRHFFKQPPDEKRAMTCDFHNGNFFGFKPSHESSF